MVFISQQFIEQLIQEDVSYFDLTTQALGISDRSGTIRSYKQIGYNLPNPREEWEAVEGKTTYN